MKLLIASNNAHKHQELREIFAAIGSPVTLITPRELGIQLDPDESAADYAGNAGLKARAFAQALRATPDPDDIYVIADDSGLEVDALHGVPGIYSARYHKRAPNGDGCAALLKELSSVPDAQRTARFQCAIVLIAPDGSEHVFYGTCEGAISHEKRGVGGFGFDPIFLLAGDTRTMAELPAQEKHRVSHRGIAARKAVAFLATRA
jgi:XTP/dITP diphosphohydrolase